jgi:hypothetical protein
MNKKYEDYLILCNFKWNWKMKWKWNYIFAKFTFSK